MTAIATRVQEKQVLCVFCGQIRRAMCFVLFFTHSANDDAVSQTQRLPQHPELFCNLIGQLPGGRPKHSVSSWKLELPYNQTHININIYSVI